ncbi:DsbA family oxidoreductase [Hyphobacterium sp. HN65]|uniref:DsbA family oxidoreductase n=1 Tax=Hyphobacterium lacteum TaxID=3116575 RepID=A0ABU7LN35_9PROT|nr:DsbA family oxidoreductase [Hyphobacterium sp. HN65]MEE2525341.1 DsbA family oxidoreductase [Hyphobacterium sp. HN65]
MTTPVRIDLVADFVCPWCWLGWRNWLAAKKIANDIKTEVTWRPYELDPSLPEEGVPYRDYMKAKFSGENEERWKAMRTHLEAAGPGVGIDFRFDSIQHRPSTVNAHRVIRWARGQSAKKADAVAEGLFEAFFRDNRDIGDMDVLVGIAEAAGLDPVIVRDLLATDRDKAEVREEEAFFHQIGVTGVPTFIFEGQFAVPGAADPQVLANALREAASLPGRE